VRTHRRDDFFARRARVDADERDRRHDVTGHAIAALHCLLIQECLLDVMQVSVTGEALDRLNGRIVHVLDRRDAGRLRHAADEDGARAALALAATELRSREMKILTQNVE
jgi:hypothetical protein